VLDQVPTRIGAHKELAQCSAHGRCISALCPSGGIVLNAKVDRVAIELLVEKRPIVLDEQGCSCLAKVSPTLQMKGFFATHVPAAEGAPTLCRAKFASVQAMSAPTSSFHLDAAPAVRGTVALRRRCAKTNYLTDDARRPWRTRRSGRSARTGGQRIYHRDGPGGLLSTVVAS